MFAWSANINLCVGSGLMWQLGVYTAPTFITSYFEQVWLTLDTCLRSLHSGGTCLRGHQLKGQLTLLQTLSLKQRFVYVITTYTKRKRRSWSSNRPTVNLKYTENGCERFYKEKARNNTSHWFLGLVSLTLPFYTGCQWYQSNGVVHEGRRYHCFGNQVKCSKIHIFALLTLIINAFAITF